MLQPISQPTLEFESPLGVMHQVLERERQASQLIHGPYEVAVMEEEQD